MKPARSTPRLPALLRTGPIALGALVLLAAGYLRTRAVRLNETLAYGVESYITTSAISPDGSWVVYMADLVTPQVAELFVSPGDGSGGTVRLSADLVAGGDVQSFQLTPDGGRVLYRADQDVDGRIDLYTVPIDGSLPAVKLNASLAATFQQFSPDGAWALLTAGTKSEIYSVPMDGSQGPVKLNGTLAGGAIQASLIRVSPDSTRVVYQAFQDSSSIRELYSVPIGGGTAVKLNGPIVAQGDVETASIGPGSDWVVYRADQITNNVIELFGVPIAGGTAVRLNGSPLAGSAIQSFSIAPGQLVPRVVYRADQDTAGRYELYAVPADGSQAPVKLNAFFGAGTDVSTYSVTPDGARAVYLTFSGQVFSAPLDGSQAAVQLSSPLPSGVVVDNFLLGPRVVYWTRDTTMPGDATDLYSVPADGSAGAVLLSGVLPGNRVSNSPVISPDGAHVVYGRTVGSYQDVYGVPIDGSLAPVKLNGSMAGVSLAPGWFAFGSATSCVLRWNPVQGYYAYALYRSPLDGSSAPVAISGGLAPFGSVESFQVCADRSRVLFTASEPLFDGPIVELFSVAPDGQTPAVRVNDPLPSAPWQGNVTEFALASDASRVVYSAPQDLYGLPQLYSVPSDGSAGAQRLDDDLGSVSGLLLMPDGESVLYLFNALYGNPFGGYFRYRLAPVDGSQAPLEMPGDLFDVAGPTITPDGERVVFRSEDFYTDAILSSLPLDGSGPAVLLEERNVQADFRLTADGSRVVYRRDYLFSGAGGPPELRSVPVDGSAAPVVLSAPLPTYGSVTAFAVTGDGAACYVADQDVLDRFELYGTPVEGGGPIVKLNGSLVANGDVVSVAAAPAGPYVVFRADKAADDRYELFSVPADGSSPNVRLNGVPVAGGDVLSFAITPDGTTVVYWADQTTNDVFELYSVPIDGSAPAVRISAPMVTNGDVSSYQITPDGDRVLYLADQGTNDVLELYGVPLTSVALTGGTVRRLSSPMVNGGDLVSFAVSADSRWVAYVADQRTDGVNELFRARTDGAWPVENLSGPLGQGGGVGGTTPAVRISADGQVVVFGADKLQDGVVELFSAVPAPAHVRAR